MSRTMDWERALSRAQARRLHGHRFFSDIRSVRISRHPTQMENTVLRQFGFILLIASLSSPGLCAQSQAGPSFAAEVRALVGADLLVLKDNRRVRLEGISLPTPHVRPREFVARLRSYLEPRVVGRRVWIQATPKKAVTPKKAPDPGKGGK